MEQDKVYIGKHQANAPATVKLFGSIFASAAKQRLSGERCTNALYRDWSNRSYTRVVEVYILCAGTVLYVRSSDNGPANEERHYSFDAVPRALAGVPPYLLQRGDPGFGIQ